MIPKVVSCYIQYRDGGNWKSGDEYYWTNYKGYTQEFLEETLSELGEDGVIPFYYSLPQIAPLDNEFLPAQGDDHSYVECHEWKFHEVEVKTPFGYPVDYYGDIEEVIYPLTNPEELNRRIELAKKEAKEILQNALKGL